MSEVFQTDIHPAAKFGHGIFFDHATGIVVGETAVLDDNVSLLQNVTLGDTGKEAGNRHPKIQQGVVIGAAAKVLSGPANDRLVNFAKQHLAEDTAQFPKALAAAKVAPQGDALVKLGEDEIGMGKAADGAALIQQGIAKGVKDKNDATLRLGQAYLAAGKKADAIKAFSSIKGESTNKTVALAHLYTLYARH